MDSITLEQARKLKSKTQEEMANCLHIHVQTYRKIEENPDTATIAEAKIISDFLGFDYNIIFFGKKLH